MMTKVDPRTRPRPARTSPAAAEPAAGAASHPRADETIAAERAVTQAARQAGYIYPEDMYKLADMGCVIGSDDLESAAQAEVARLRARCPNHFTGRRSAGSPPQPLPGDGSPGSRGVSSGQIKDAMWRSGRYIPM